MMRSTSRSVSVAATTSSRCSTTQPSASSGSKTASGGSSLRRAASRNTSAAAIASTTPTTTKTTTQVTSVPRSHARSARPGVPFVCGNASDADALGEQLAVVRGVAEQDLRALGALEVQVRVVLPREADATVDLDVLRGGVEVRVRAVGLGERRHHRQLVVVLGRGPRRVV